MKTGDLLYIVLLNRFCDVGTEGEVSPVIRTISKMITTFDMRLLGEKDAFHHIGDNILLQIPISRYKTFQIAKTKMK